MKILKKIISLPVSIYYNFRIFPFCTAIKLPLLIHYNTRIIARKNSIVIKGDIQRFMFKFGYQGSDGIIEKQYSYLSIKNNGKLIIDGKTVIAPGCSIRIEPNAQLHLGQNFSINKNSFIYCAYNINIGDDVLIGWNVDIRDNDGHDIYYNDGSKNKIRSINIGKHVWIASNTSILKCSLGDNIVIASNTIVYKSFLDSNILIGGQPAKLLKENIEWHI